MALLITPTSQATQLTRERPKSEAPPFWTLAEKSDREAILIKESAKIMNLDSGLSFPKCGILIHYKNRSLSIFKDF